MVIRCSDTFNPGRPLTFTAALSGGDPNVAPTFDWQLSGNGTIIAGQGTSSINVATAHAPIRQPVEAMVRVGGFSRKCPSWFSCAMEPASTSWITQTKKIDEYGEIYPTEELTRLDGLVLALQEEPGSRGYIIVYARTK